MRGGEVRATEWQETVEEIFRLQVDIERVAEGISS
jgi:hypothetical protein